MINYLYYKLYRSYSKKNLGSTPEFLSAGVLTCLLFINLLVVNAFLAKFNFIPFLISSSVQGGIYIMILLLIILFIFRTNRRDAIIKKYSQESQTESARGNILVIVYVILTILMIFVVAFFRPGYVPSF